MLNLADNYYNKLKQILKGYEIDFVALDKEDILCYLNFTGSKFNPQKNKTFSNLKIISTNEKEKYILCSYPINKLK